MLAPSQPACLVIADISGYTGYVAGVELDHAQDILADLINRVVKSLRPTFRLAKLEGDAAFVYAMTDKVDGSLLQDTIEATYFAFRRRQRDIKQSSSCECDACRRIPQLDLKFVAHHGEVAVQKMAGRDELVGRDVILIHRLLKNAVASTFGDRAYALYTQNCVAATGIDPEKQGLVDHTETTDVAGAVRCWLKDLHAAWREEQERRHIIVAPEAALLTVFYDLPAPRPLVWEYATVPGRRVLWSGAAAITESQPTGRRGAGATNHCLHGEDTVVEEVLDWRPYDHLTTRDQMPMPGAPKILMSDIFSELPDGRTRLEVRIGPEKPRDRPAVEQMLPMLEPMLHEVCKGLIAVLEEASRSGGGKAASQSIEEPPLPATSGRLASEAAAPMA